MAVSEERVKQDVKRIEELGRKHGGRIVLERKSASTLFVTLKYRTAPSNQYPSKVQDETKIKIELLAKYPFVEPKVTIATPVFHPNVYSSGLICFGTKWLPTQGLDLLVQRVVQIITFDKSILNEDSPANRAALDWYRRARSQHSSAFPTDTFNPHGEPRKKMVWKNLK